jgi:hypothetical protein
VYDPATNQVSATGLTVPYVKSLATGTVNPGDGFFYTYGGVLTGAYTNNMTVVQF